LVRCSRYASTVVNVSAVAQLENSSINSAKKCFTIEISQKSN
jgi:hypothetical protein